MLLLSSALANPNTVVAPTLPDQDEVYLQVHAGRGATGGLTHMRAGLSGYYGAVDFSLAWAPNAGLANVTSLRGPEFPLGPDWAVCSPYGALVGFWIPTDTWFELVGWNFAAGLAVAWERGRWDVDLAIPAVTLSLMEETDFGAGNWKLWAVNSEVAAAWTLEHLTLVAGAVSSVPTAAVRMEVEGWGMELRETGWPGRGFSVTLGVSYRHPADTTWMMPEESR